MTDRFFIHGKLQALVISDEHRLTGSISRNRWRWQWLSNARLENDGRWSWCSVVRWRHPKSVLSSFCLPSLQIWFYVALSNIETASTTLYTRPFFAKPKPTYGSLLHSNLHIILPQASPVELCEALKLCGLNASEAGWHDVNRSVASRGVETQAAAATVMQEIDKALSWEWPEMSRYGSPLGIKPSFAVRIHELFDSGIYSGRQLRNPLNPFACKSRPP